MSSRITPAKILLVSASVGAGHTQAAQAIKAVIESQGLAKVEVVDFMAGDNSYLNTLVKETYLKMINIFPDMYDLLYRWSQMPLPGGKVQNLMAWAMKRSMLKLIKSHRPDAIICTHPFPCGAAAYLKRTRKINLPLAGVITDFAVHRLWCYDETDQYFVATAELAVALAARGIAPERIHATGIPISPSFGQQPSAVSRNAIRTTLGFSNSHPVILMMGGGLGLGALEQAVLDLDALQLPLNLIVVAGRNAALRRNLAAKAKQMNHPVKVLGYTRHVPELMAAADLLITKPGALTISEALATKLPLLLYHPLPGQEEENAAYLARKGAALWLHEDSNLAATVQQLFTHPEQLTYMRKMAAILGRPAAAQTVANTICNHLIRNEIHTLSRSQFL